MVTTFDVENFVKELQAYQSKAIKLSDWISQNKVNVYVSEETEKRINQGVLDYLIFMDELEESSQISGFDLTSNLYARLHNSGFSLRETEIMIFYFTINHVKEELSNCVEESEKESIYNLWKKEFKQAGLPVDNDLEWQVLWTIRSYCNYYKYHVKAENFKELALDKELAAVFENYKKLKEKKGLIKISKDSKRYFEDVLLQEELDKLLPYGYTLDENGNIKKR